MTPCCPVEGRGESNEAVKESAFELISEGDVVARRRPAVQPSAGGPLFPLPRGGSAACYSGQLRGIN